VIETPRPQGHDVRLRQRGREWRAGHSFRVSLPDSPLDGRGRGGKLGGGLRLPPIVNHTMNTARNSATSASRSIHAIAMLSCVAALCALVGSCVVPRAVAPAGPGAATSTAPQERAGVTFRPVPYSALPGWSSDTPSAALLPFAASCRSLMAGAESSMLWRTACSAASAIGPRDDAGARAFFEAQFTPYRVIAEDGADAGRVTGYYEPLLRGSRSRTDRYRYPLYASPDDLLTIDLGEMFPELKSERVRGRLDGKRVVPYWSRADIEAGRATLVSRALVWLDDPVEAFFVHVQGAARIQLADRSTVRVGYADQNGYPYRSIGRVLIEQGELTLEQASMQGIKGARRSACRRPDDSRRSPRSSAGCAGVPGDDSPAVRCAVAASGPGAGYGRSDQGCVARRFFLGHW